MASVTGASSGPTIGDRRDRRSARLDGAQLVFVPSFYVIVDRLGDRTRAFFGRFVNKADEPDGHAASVPEALPAGPAKTLRLAAEIGQRGRHRMTEASTSAPPRSTGRYWGLPRR